MQKDNDMLEKVQRRATRMIRYYRTLMYKKRLERCGLTTLDKRRHRGDLIEIYKLMTNKEEIPFSRCFQRANSSGLLGHRYKIFRKSEGAIKRLFSSRAVEDWNELGDRQFQWELLRPSKTN